MLQNIPDLAIYLFQGWANCGSDDKLHGSCCRRLPHAVRCCCSGKKKSQDWATKPLYDYNSNFRWLLFCACWSVPKSGQKIHLDLPGTGRERVFLLLHFSLIKSFHWIPEQKYLGHFPMLSFSLLFVFP